MNQSVSISYSKPNLSRSRGSIWARLEQEYKSDNNGNAGIYDVGQMVAQARSGKSSFGYVRTICPYATMKDTIITIELDFFVWTSSVDLPYTLTTNIGEIGDPVLFERPTSLDVVFANSNFQELPYVFDGELSPQMPYFNDKGEEISAPDITLSDSEIQLSKRVYQVLRADGNGLGYKHTITIEIDTTPAPLTEEEIAAGEVVETLKAENLQVTILLTYTNEDGELLITPLSMDIPQCVVDLLAYCGSGIPLWQTTCKGFFCDGRFLYYVYYNTCDGEVIEVRSIFNE